MSARLAALRLLPIGLLLAAPPARAQDDRHLPVTVVVSGEGAEAVRAAVESPGDLPVETSFAELPTVAGAPSVAPPDDSVAQARRAYINAEFGACLASLDDDARVHAALAEGRPQLAARVLFWRVACHVGAADLEGARRAAARFATFGLEVPAEAEAASPEVEAVLADALEAAAGRERASLAVAANTRASVAVDGRAPGCETPCALDLVPGDHVVALRASGFADAWRLVRVEADGAETELSLDEASPELAARQWARRWIGREGRDSPPSVRLLARAVRARRLVLLLVDPAAEGSHLRGVLALDGRIAARGERTSASVDDASVGLLRDLLVEGGAVEPGQEFYESPWFWIGIGAAALLAAGLTAWLLYEPDTRTRVGFGR